MGLEGFGGKPGLSANCAVVPVGRMGLPMSLHRVVVGGRDCCVFFDTVRHHDCSNPPAVLQDPLPHGEVGSRPVGAAPTTVRPSAQEQPSSIHLPVPFPRLESPGVIRAKSKQAPDCLKVKQGAYI